MNRLEKFLENNFKVQNDNLGIPSIILIEGVERSLIQSIDRNTMFNVMNKFLITKMALDNEKSKQITNAYLNRKYKEYVNFVLNL